MMSDWAIALAITGMSAATYLTRAGGFWLMHLVRVTKRVERLLRVLAGSVFVAIATGGAVKGDSASWVAIGAAMAAMVIGRNAVAAILAGVLAAALWRLVGRL